MAGAAGRERLSDRRGPAPGFLLDAGGRLSRDPSREAVEEAVRSGRGRLWLDIDSRREEEWLLLTQVFRFHPLAIEDTRSPHCRVKLEEYEDHLFLVVRGVRFATWTPEPYDLEAPNLYLFLGRNYLVTVHAEPSAAVDTVAERLAAAPDLMGRGVAYLAHMLVDTVVDLYFPVLDEIDTFVDELEEGIFQGGGREAMGRIFELKRTLLALRRHLAPMREVVASLANRPSPYLGADLQIYFRDVYDHVVRQVESIEMYRELVTGALEMQLTLFSNRINEVVKALSIIATVVLPPTLIASIYGMNFEFMPGLDSPIGFWVALLGMAVVSGGLLLYVWWKGWL